ncbi:hypothetical protein FZH45_09500 [Salmonella enterica]|uniref:Uncharacterized protein n=2 Tax=Salmonella enterica TaxID=28901 RepID=A0A616ALE9_SALER|nr:hypothetical protein [Salmonella enterica]EDN5013600.1 hypothetical protein [Salmonella enterica subsp. enterica serovar Javiana]EED8330789.1 hypothetical protein [Salmonella enterica subsp. enterica serovar Thompson]HAA1151013.1 hypothetical protein [Salmonella enterica subsp. enterica serovar Pullorum]EAM2651714.1 hypothetical protein [Salmonella enterica]EAM6473595.1 hypothetical protein [Salmonella enterica]
MLFCCLPAILPDGTVEAMDNRDYQYHRIMPQPLFPVQRQAKQDGYLHRVFPAGKYGLLARQFPVGQTAKKQIG